MKATGVFLLEQLVNIASRSVVIMSKKQLLGGSMNG